MGDAMDEEASEDSGVLLSLLNITATVTTILMFLTGVTPCREVQIVYRVTHQAVP